MANEMASLCEDVRRIIVQKTLAAQDMLYTIQGGYDEVMFFVTRNMSDPPWHMRFTMVHFLGWDEEYRPTKPPYVVEMLTRSKSMFECMLRLYFEDEWTKWNHAYSGYYHQGLKEPPALWMPWAGEQGNQWVPFSSSAIRMYYDMDRSGRTESLEVLLSAMTRDIELLLATA